MIFFHLLWRQKRGISRKGESEIFVTRILWQTSEERVIMIMMSASEKAAAELDSNFEQVQVKYYFWKKALTKKDQMDFFLPKSVFTLRQAKILEWRLNKKIVRLWAESEPGLGLDAPGPI